MLKEQQVLEDDLGLFEEEFHEKIPPNDANEIDYFDLDIIYIFDLIHYT